MAVFVNGRPFYTPPGTLPKMYAFERDFATLVSRLPITVLAAVINKQEYANDTAAAARPPKDPTWPLDLYHIAFDFILERFVAFLEQQSGAGTIVIAEARGKKEDRQLSEHYHYRRVTPTQFYSAERFALLPDRLEFRGKDDQVAGLELADMLAPQIASCTLGHDETRLLVWQATKPKIWMRGDGQPGGVGLKTFPSRIGRQIMGAPLKSPEGP